VLDIDRLDEMLVEARWVSARHAGGLCVTADSDQPDLLQLRIGSEQSQEVKTIHVGQSDIQQRDTGLEFARDGQGILSAVGNLHRVSLQVQQLREQRGRSGVVVYDHHAARSGLRVQLVLHRSAFRACAPRGAPQGTSICVGQKRKEHSQTRAAAVGAGKKIPPAELRDPFAR